MPNYTPNSQNTTKHNPKCKLEAMGPEARAAALRIAGLSTAHIGPLSGQVDDNGATAAGRRPVRSAGGALRRGLSKPQQSLGSAFPPANRGDTAHQQSEGGAPESSVTLWDGGGLAKVVRADRGQPERVGGGLRGDVRVFSRGSRRRLMRLLATLQQTALPVFVTLTYPGVFPDQPAEYKGHWRAWVKRLRRRWPSAALVWRLEFQKRGAAHFHAFVWGVNYGDLRPWAAGAWYEVVGSGDLRHLAAGVRVEEVRSWRGVSSYASKYLAKVDGQIVTGVGRWWGVENRAGLPEAVQVVVSLSHQEAQTLLRYWRRFAKLKSRDYKGLTVFCAAGQWLEAIIGGLLKV